jgi:HAD superfamily hydrolase (TIGR01549 family)
MNDSVNRTGGLQRVPPVLFFDLDNTLVDHSGALRRGLELVCEQWPRLLRDHSYAAAAEAFEEINERLWTIYATGAFDSGVLRVRRFEQWFRFLGVDTGEGGVPAPDEASTFYMEAYANATLPYDGIVPMIEALAARHVLGIISNGFITAQDRKLAVSGLERFITHRVFSEHVGVQKPHPAIFAAALERAGVRAGDALYVGDNFANDIAGAAAAGMATVWFNPPDDEHPQSHPHVTPDAVVHSVAQLAELLGAS